MSNHSIFPTSARAAWLLRHGKLPQPGPMTPEDREQRLLARELARNLREANVEQLTAVAQLLGRSAQWLAMAKTLARYPGSVGRAVLREIR